MAAHMQRAHVRDEWDWVEEGVSSIINSTSFLIMRPEDVYAELLYEDAMLWVANDAFVITKIEHCHYERVTELLIWFMWARIKGNDVAEKYTPFLQELANVAGAVRLKCGTYNPAAARLFSSQGWHREIQVLTLEAGNG